MNSTNPRDIAVSVLVDVNMGGAYNNIRLRNALSASGLSRADKAFITEIVNGVLRNRIYLDYALGAYSKTPLAKLKPFVRETMRCAAYQMIFMDRVPQFAACNEAVKLIKNRGMHGLAPFVNGVLRNLARGKDELVMPNPGTLEYLCMKYSYEPWLLEYWLEHYGWHMLEEICRAFALPPSISIAVNTQKISTDQLAQELREEGIEVRPGSFEDSLVISSLPDIASLDAFKNGSFMVMDESSIMAVRALGGISKAWPGLIMDVCSAPGSKAFYAAWLSGGKASIHAFDIHEHKLQLMAKAAVRLGVSSVKIALADARKPLEGYEERAGAVLVDGPCSGFGLIRKKPDIKYRKKMEDVEQLAALQRKILANVSGYVAPGGVLVYSVCTISALECEQQALWFAENYPFELEEIDNTEGMPGIFRLGKGMVQILPIGGNSDGFFIAKFRRRKS